MTETAQGQVAPDPTIKVKEFLAAQNVSKVGVVDDGFDLPDEVDLQTRWKEFVEEASAVPALAGQFTALGIDPDGDESAQEIADMDRVIREKGGDLAEVLDKKVKTSPDQNLRKAGIKNLTELLEGRLALELRKLGTDAARRIEELVGTQIVFLDYYLGDENPKGIAAAVSVVKKVCEQCRTRKKPVPMFVLFSRSNLSPADVAKLRRKANIPAWQFRFIPKDKLSRDTDIVLRLWELAHGLEGMRGIERFMNRFEQTLDKAQEGLTKTLRELDLSDIAYLDSMKLNAERASLSQYLTWLFGAYLQSGILRNEDYRKAAEALDKLDLTHLPTLHGEPTRQVLELYRDVLYEPAYRTLGKDETGRRKARLQLGEIYLRSRRGGKKDALLVINNSCDLARPSAEMTVGLLRGQVIDRGKAIDISSRQRAARSDAFGIDRKHYVIDWTLDGSENIDHGSVFKWLKRERYELAARMRLENVLEIKQRVSTLRDRIGLPSAPPMLSQLRVLGVFWKDAAGKFQQLAGESDRYKAELFSIDTYTDAGKREERYFFSSDFLARMVNEIETKVAANTGDQTLKTLHKWAANYGKLTALMYPKKRNELDPWDVRLQPAPEAGEASGSSKSLVVFAAARS